MATSYTHDMAHVVTGEAARLKQFLSGMTQQDWDADSACQGWIVEDIVAHLAGSAGNWAASITRALDGDAGPPPGGSFLAPGDRASHPFGPEIRQSRHQTRDELLANFISGHEHLANVLAGVKEEDWEKLCFHRRGPLPMWQYLGVQLQELTLHGVGHPLRVGRFRRVVGRAPRSNDWHGTPLAAHRVHREPRHANAGALPV